MLTIEKCSKYAYDSTFTYLQEFNMQTYGLGDLQSWIEFFKKNSNIRRFNLYFHYCRVEPFEMIAPYLENIEEITLSVILEHQFHAIVINATTTINFIEQHEKLKRLELYECNSKLSANIEWNVEYQELGTNASYFIEKMHFRF